MTNELCGIEGCTQNTYQDPVLKLSYNHPLYALDIGIGYGDYPDHFHYVKSIIPFELDSPEYEQTIEDISDMLKVEESIVRNKMESDELFKEYLPPPIVTGKQAQMV